MAGRGIVQELTRRIKWNPLFRKLANRSVPIQRPHFNFALTEFPSLLVSLQPPSSP